MGTTPQPSEIRLDRSKRLLKVTFDDGSSFELPSEYLRVYSTSAEVKGHGSEEGILRLEVLAGDRRVVQLVLVDSLSPRCVLALALARAASGESASADSRWQ